MKKTLHLTLFLGLLLFSGQVFGQISWSPTFPTADEPVTITYDATQGTSSLPGASSVYMHAGVILSGPNGTAWENVVGNWGQADGIGQMTPVPGQTDVWEITITPRTYFNVAAGETIYRIGMVFREEGPCSSCDEGKSDSNGDIFMPIYTNNLSVQFTSPSQRPQLFESTGQQLNISFEASSEANLELMINDVSVANATAATELTHNFTVNQAGKIWIKAMATDGNVTAMDSFYVLVHEAPTVQAVPGNTQDGITYLSATSARLVLFAPDKKRVYLIGDFNNWELDPTYQLNRTADGSRYWIDLSGLTPKEEYAFQYWIEDNTGKVVSVGDPYAEKVLDPWNDEFIPESVYPNLKPYPRGKATDPVSVLQTDQTPYQWKTNNFTPPAKEDLIIYELLIRDMFEDHAYKTLKDSLPYLKKLGINAIELMPVMEFEGNESWGYNPSFYFAPDKYYGTKNDLKELIDAAHAEGIAVILDMVLNHAFGQCPLVRMYWDEANQRPAANSPYFNPIARHPFNVGFDFNHDAPATQEFSNRVIRYWMEEYRMDGFRFDLSKGFTQRNTGSDVGAWTAYEQARVDTWRRIADFMWSIDPDSYVILEHFGSEDEERVLTDYGMMVWQNLNHNTNQATMGYDQNSLASAFHLNRGFQTNNSIAFMESHDEERLMFRNLNFGNSFQGHNVRDLSTALLRNQAAAAVFQAIPGPRMLWQFGELGFELSINRCPDGSISGDCRTANKPPKWEYLEEQNRVNLYNVYAAMHELRRGADASFDFGSFNIREDGFDGLVKRVRIDHSGVDVIVIANLTMSDATVSPNFTQTGKWYDYLSGDSLMVSDVDAGISLRPGQFHVLTNQHIRHGKGSDFNDYALPNRFPNPPSDLTYDQANNQLYWRDNADNEANFILEVKVGNGSFTQEAELPANTTTYKLSFEDEDDGQQRTYRVKAVNNIAESPYSNETGFTVSGLEEGWAAQLRLFPNPTTEQITVRYAGAHTGKAQLRLMDISGKQWNAWEVEATALATGISFTLPESGLYLLQITLEDGRSTVKRVVRN